MTPAIAPMDTDEFLEIGPGAGALTIPLAAVVDRVVAVEIDRDLAATLRSTAQDNVVVVEHDFLDLTADRLRAAFGVKEISHTAQKRVREVSDASPRPWRVVGNLPYNVASPILFKLVDLYRSGAGLVDATLMLH